MTNPRHRSLQRVLLIGPPPSGKGGISSVQQSLLRCSPENVEYIPIYTHGGSLWSKMIRLFLAWLSVSYYVRFGKIDFAHIHFASRASTFRKWLLWRTTGLTTKPFLLHAHGAEFHLFYKQLSPRLRKRYSKWIQSSYALVTLSKDWKTFYHDEIGVPEERIQILLNPVQWPKNTQPSPDPYSDSSKFRILFLGRIGSRKGAFDLINAFNNCRNEIKNKATLTLAGDGDVELARELIRSLGLQSHAEVKDWLGNEEKQELLRHSHLFVLPSWNEGVPMALLEAMAYGLVPIVTPIGGMKDIIEHEKNGLLVEPGNVNAITLAIEALLDNPERLLKLRQSARNTVQELREESYVQRLAEVYAYAGMR